MTTSVFLPDEIQSRTHLGFGLEARLTQFFFGKLWCCRPGRILIAVICGGCLSRLRVVVSLW